MEPLAKREEGRARMSHDKMSWSVLVTHLLGLPFHGSPVCDLVYPFGFPPSSTRATGPHPVVGSELGRRGGGGG